MKRMALIGLLAALVAGCGDDAPAKPRLPEPLARACRAAFSVAVTTEGGADIAADSGTAAGKFDFDMAAKSRKDMDRRVAALSNTSKIDRWVLLARKVDDARVAARSAADYRGVRKLAADAKKTMLDTKSFERDCG